MRHPALFSGRTRKKVHAARMPPRVDEAYAGLNPLYDKPLVNVGVRLADLAPGLHIAAAEDLMHVLTSLQRP